VFSTQRNIGLVRLDDGEIVKTTESDRRRMQKTAKKSLEKLSVVSYENLTDDAKKQHLVASAQMGVIALLSNASASKKIESKVSVNSSVIAIGETLKLFTEAP
jgi:hypothetical protein